MPTTVRRIRTAVAASSLTLAVGLHAQARQQLVLDGVTVVDTRTGKLSPARAVVIEGDHIVRIAAAGSIRPSAGMRLVPARGKFVVPGYLDMHAHPLTTGATPGDLRMMLSMGVTGYRQMNGSPELLAARRAGALRYADSPTLLALPGTIITGPRFASPEATVAEVRSQKAQGADFIKAIDLPPPALSAAHGEAKADGLIITGHLSPTVDVRQAAAMGMDGIEHLGPRESVLLGCSSQEAALRADPPSAPRRAPDARAGAPGLGASSAGAPPSPAMLARILVNPIAFTPPAAFARYAQVLNSYDAVKCRELAGEFVQHRIWQTPTLIRLRTMEIGDDPAYVNDPNLRYVSHANRELWLSVAQQFHATIGAPARAELNRLFTAQLALTKLFYDQGVPMMAGSDLGGGFVVAGYGLHQEFDLLAQAGLPPLAVLQMTTLNGATFLGREGTMGTVEPGKVADLVLLDANPVQSVANLHRINAVVHDGRFYSADDLAALRRRTEAESR